MAASPGFECGVTNGMLLHIIIVWPLIPLARDRGLHFPFLPEPRMKVLSSLKDAKTRHRDCQVVKRRGRIYVICKSNPRFKARQGGAKNK